MVALREALRRESACFGPRRVPGVRDLARDAYKKVLDGDAPGVQLDATEDAWVRGVRERCGRLVTIVEVQSVAPEGCLPSTPSGDAFELGFRMHAVALEAWGRAAGGDFSEAARLAGRAIRVAAILGRSDAELDWMIADTAIVDLAKLVDRWLPHFGEAARGDVAEDVAAARSAILGEAERFVAYARGLRARALAVSPTDVDRVLMLDTIDLLLGEIDRGDSFDVISARCAEERKEDVLQIEAFDRMKARPADLDPAERRVFLRYQRGELVRPFEALRKRGLEAARALDELAARL